MATPQQKAASTNKTAEAVRGIVGKVGGVGFLSVPPTDLQQRQAWAQQLGRSVLGAKFAPAAAVSGTETCSKGGTASLSGDIAVTTNPTFPLPSPNPNAYTSAFNI